MKTIKELKCTLDNDLKKYSKVFLIGHNGPDFDSIGSCIGLYRLARHYNKPAYIIVDDEPSKIEPGVKTIIDDSKDSIKYINKDRFLKLANSKSLLIVADVNKKDMISVGDSLDKVGKTIVIDHHNENGNTIETHDKFISLDVSSTCEIVTSLLNMLKIPYDEKTANYLLTGISLDTKKFQSDVSAKTHDTAEKLMKKGAKAEFVNNMFLEDYENYCKINSLIINGTQLKKYTDSALTPIQVSFTLNRTQPGTIYNKEDFAKAADQMIKFKGFDAAFVLGFVDTDVIHVSGRSTGSSKVDVSKILDSIGGGGNRQNAGARVNGNSLEEIESAIQENVPLGLPDDANVIEKPKLIKLKKNARKV